MIFLARQVVDSEKSKIFSKSSRSHYRITRASQNLSTPVFAVFAISFDIESLKLCSFEFEASAKSFFVVVQFSDDFLSLAKMKDNLGSADIGTINATGVFKISYV